MYRVLVCSVVTIITITFASYNSHASTVIGLNFNKVVDGAELIFEGEVLSKEVRPNNTNGMPFTFFTFRIIEVLKGAYPTETIELGFMGGIQDGNLLTVTDMTMPEIGETGVYFVESLARQQVHPLLGWHQGHYRVVPGGADGKEKRVVPTEAAPGVVYGSKGASSFRKENAPSLDKFKDSIKSIVNTSK